MVTRSPPAAEALGVEPGDAWHVGDSLSADVAGANAAGLGAVWLNRDGLVRRGGDPEPDHDIVVARAGPAVPAPTRRD